ncbi:MAG: MFS transporter [Rhodobacteraceae bacterium]|nr:MFS transporter [Paracoccaceae bacterium]
MSAANIQNGSVTAEKAKLELDELVVTVIMARVTDYFGFFVYAIASVIVFPRLVFSNYDPGTAILLSFAVFSLAFLARPISSQLFKMIERKMGRSGKIGIALLLLGTATMAIGLLPVYETAGVLSPILLIVFRIAQGVGLGGSWDGLTLLLQSNAPEGRRGWYAMIPQLGAPIGLCVAAAVFYVLTGFLTEQEFYAWGWRWPFFAVLAVNVVSLFARLQLIHSDDHQILKEEVQLKSAPMMEMLKIHWRDVLLAAFLPLASYAILHMMTVFPLAYNYLMDVEPMSWTLLLMLIGGVICIPSVVFSGILADRYGRRRMLAIMSILIGVFGLLITVLLEEHAAYILVGFVLLGLSYGQASAIVPNRFKLKYRYSGAALATNLSWIFGAAFAPLVATGLTMEFGVAFAGLYLLSGAVVTLLALVILKRREANSDLA